MRGVDQWVEENRGEEAAIMPVAQCVPMAETEEQMAEQRGAGGSKDRKNRVVLPKYVLVPKGSMDEVTAVEARGDRFAMVWREEVAKEEVLVVTDSDDDPIVEEEMFVRLGANYLLNPFFGE
jgi:hypothetical protein